MHEPDQTARDPQLRTAMTAMVGEMADAAGSNRRLQDEAGVSEATVRNFRRGKFPHSSVAMARRLDGWAVAALDDHPPAGSPGSLTEMLARWQGRSTDEIGELGRGDDGADNGAEDGADDGADEVGAGRGGPGPTRLLVRALAAGSLVLLAGVVVLAWRLLDDGSEPSGTASVRVDRDLPLDDGNFCGWTLGTDPVPLVSADPLVMRVDARCNNPAEPDPVLDTGASVYDAPSNDTGTKVGVIRSGNTFVPACWTTSTDVVTDGSTPPNESPLWLRAEEPDGWLPMVNVGGGYTREQLLDLGLARC